MPSTYIASEIAYLLRAGAWDLIRAMCTAQMFQRQSNTLWRGPYHRESEVSSRHVLLVDNRWIWCASFFFALLCNHYCVLCGRFLCILVRNQLEIALPIRQVWSIAAGNGICHGEPSTLSCLHRRGISWAIPNLAEESNEISYQDLGR